jgi:hypothetical protein
MKKFFAIFILLAASVSAAAQAKPTPAVRRSPSEVPIKEKPAVLGVDAGKLVGKTYTNREFGFEVAFPETWFIPGDDFESFMREKGYDLRVKANPGDPQMQANVRRFEKNVVLLLTAYRSMPGTRGNAIVHISVEDLTDNPAVKDAVDYFDLMRAQISTMKLPANYSISDVQAEKLGTRQFAYVDINTGTGKRRLYAYVKGPRAVMFTIAYTADADLAVLRRVLEEGNFSLK